MNDDGTASLTRDRPSAETIAAPDRPRMNRIARWTLLASIPTMTISGLVYGFILYLMSPMGEWTVVHHPLQMPLLHLHVGAGVLLIASVALIARRHILAPLLDGTMVRARSGLTILIVLTVMTVSGVLVNLSVTDTLATVSATLHGIASLLFVAVFAGHFVKALVDRRQRPNSHIV